MPSRITSQSINDTAHTTQHVHALYYELQNTRYYSGSAFRRADAHARGNPLQRLGNVVPAARPEGAHNFLQELHPKKVRESRRFPAPLHLHRGLRANRARRGLAAHGPARGG